MSVFARYASVAPLAASSLMPQDVAAYRGREVSAQEILERTELVLDGRFARIVSTADALA